MLQKSQKNLLTENKKISFYCDICNYTTSKKHDYIKHEKTQKHIKRARNHVTENSLAGEQTDFYCKCCGGNYNNRVSLWRHEKKCVGSPIQQDDSSETDSKKISGSDMDADTDDEIESNYFTKDIVMNLIKQNKELQNVLIEQNNKLLEQNNKLIEKSNNTIQNNTTNNTTNNTQFNLNFFLNEQCKDAINIIDFINSLQVQVKDLERTGQLGYVEGISQIFLNGLRELDVYTRPIHCTDFKRETVYVKDQDKWEKENVDKTRLKQAVKRIATKNLKQLPEWEKENPEFSNFNSKESDQYVILTQRLLGGVNAEEDNKYEDKIIRNVLRDVVLEKG